MAKDPDRTRAIYSRSMLRCFLGAKSSRVDLSRVTKDERLLYVISSMSGQA